MQVNPRNGDLAIAVLLLAVAAFFLWGGWHMPAGTFAVPGPGIVPTILSVLLAVALVISNGDYGIFLQGAFSQVFLGAVVLLALLQGAAWLAGVRKKALCEVK